MNLPLIIACITIVLALIIFPLIVSYKAEKNNDGTWEMEKWDKRKFDALLNNAGGGEGGDGGGGGGVC